MIVRRRSRKVLVVLALYGIAAGGAAYFVHHAHNGSRGLQAKYQIKQQIVEVGRDLDALRAERAEWEHRLSLLRSDQIDRDLLEERARTLLGRVHRSDLVIITGE